MEIALPPLRERREDIPVLADYFLRQVGNDKTLSDEAHKRLLKHSWPGNVRELKNAIERAAMLARAAVITTADLTFGVAGGDQVNSLDGLLDRELAPPIPPLARAMIRHALSEPL